jgi:hypothetical protein
MTKKVNDPVSYLRGLVSGRGKSSSEGVYYVHPVVIAEVDEDYGYDVDRDPAWYAHDAFSYSSDDFNKTLVQLRKGSGVFASTLSDCGDFIEFISEDHDLTMCVTIPSTNLEDFTYKVVYYQTLLKKVATFAGRTPTNIRFSIGIATMSWEELVDSGNAK